MAASAANGPVAFNEIAAAHFDGLRIDPGGVGGEQGGDDTADNVGLTNAAQRSLPGEHGFECRI